MILSQSGEHSQRLETLLRDSSGCALACLYPHVGCACLPSVVLSRVGTNPQIKSLKATIGYFEADPNRVVGIMLTAYAAHPSVAAYQQLLGLFTRELVTQTLGFMLKHQSVPEEETAEGLLLVVAHLVKVTLSRDSSPGMPALRSHLEREWDEI